jgi:hypothetical protein
MCKKASHLQRMGVLDKEIDGYTKSKETTLNFVYTINVYFVV